MKKTEEEAKKRRTTDVYSSTYDNGGWSKRDALPKGDPIGDVVEEDKKSYKDKMKLVPDSFIRDNKKLYEAMKDRLIFPEGKLPYDPGFGISLKSSTCCDKPSKYKNIVSTSLKFWSCRNCGADLGDIE